jgi:hypothetical protein
MRSVCRMGARERGERFVEIERARRTQGVLRERARPRTKTRDVLARLGVHLIARHEERALQRFTRRARGAVETELAGAFDLAQERTRAARQRRDRQRATMLVHRHARERRPERAFDERHAPLDELHHEHVVALFERRKQAKNDFPARVPPPSTLHALARDRVDERALSRHRHEPASSHERADGGERGEHRPIIDSPSPLTCRSRST